MVDWDQVERLRSKGWDWARIAEDERVDFTAEAAAGDAGRQLRALYYQRRSRSQRRGGGGGTGEGGKTDERADRPPLLLRIGYIIGPLFGLWALLAFVLPWPALVVPFLDVLFVFIVAALVLLFALFRARTRWESALRGPLAIGIVLGLLIPGALSLVAIQEGCPTLQKSAAASYNLGWARYANPVWKIDGAPVFFFYGSIACPYCSASSWAMAYALQRFGTLSGTSLTHSNPGDSPANVPEVDMSGASLQSPYVSLQSYEGTNDNSILPLPSLPNCQTSAYYSVYDSGQTIPFVVIGGVYVHAGASLVDPLLLVNGTSGPPLTPQQAQAQMNAQSGATWNAAAPQVYMMEAMIVKLNGGQPASVANDPSVANYLAQLK